MGLVSMGSLVAIITQARHMTLNNLHTTAILLLAAFGIGGIIVSIAAIAYALNIKSRIQGLKDTCWTAHCRYESLLADLKPMKELPRVCKHCSTIGYRHYATCPYAIVYTALHNAEKRA